MDKYIKTGLLHAIKRLEKADRQLEAGSEPAEAQLEILAARNMLQELVTLDEGEHACDIVF